MEFVKVFFVMAVIRDCVMGSLQTDIEAEIKTGQTLNRKKRYLVFPEGSSLQLVYCLTMPSLGAGSIFTIGNTAALAWQLPHDPFVAFRKPSELLHRADKDNGEKKVRWKSEEGTGETSPLKTHYDPFFINKPSYTTIVQRPSSNTRLYQSVSYTNGNYYGNEKPVTTYLHPVYHKVYRRTRRDLYGKIEKLFTAFNRDGRSCLLKSVCEVSKATRERGTFMEEIIKAIFRVRHEQDVGGEDLDHYDSAADKQVNCTDMYPTCEASIWTGMFSFS